MVRTQLEYLARLAAGFCLVTNACSCGRRPPAPLAATSAAPAASFAARAAEPSQVASAAPTATASSKSVSPTHAVPVPEVCSALVAEQRALAAQWPEPSYVPPVVGSCYPTHGGAWAVVFDSLHRTEAPGLTARFTVVHLARSPQDGAAPTRALAPFEPSPFVGERGAPAVPAGQNYALEVGTYYTNVFAPTLFDYDADGEAELIFTAQAYVEEGTVSRSIGRIFSFSNGTVHQYSRAPSLRWSSVTDIDDDHRPDLVGSYLTVPVAAHSHPDGSFSLLDHAARAFAKRACPAGQTAVFLPTSNDAGLPPGYTDSGWNGPCARLWGASADGVLAEIARHCSANSCVTKSVVSDAVVESADTYRRDALLIPPLRLDKAEP